MTHVSRRTVHAECSSRAFRFDEQSVHRTAAAPCLLYVRIHSRRNGMSPPARALGRAAGLCEDLRSQSGRCHVHPHLLSGLFHGGSESRSAVLPRDRRITVIVSAASHRAPDRKRTPSTRPATPPPASCWRCGGLLVADYSASLACDSAGTLVTLWRCVNCGDCMDRCILANRLQSPMPARRRARPPTGPPRTERSRGAGTGITR